MKIMWSSNSPWTASGYGVQSKYLMPRFTALGHQVAIHAWYGLEGGMLEMNGIPIYPKGFELYGNDIAQAHYMHAESDILVSLIDVWVLHGFGKKSMRWIPYMPIDMETSDGKPPQIILNALEGAYRVVSYARYGERILNNAGISNVMIPHGVDTKIFAPADKVAAKKKMNFAEDAFVIGMVAANKGYPSRKAFPENMQAVANFKQRHPHRKVKLYLHTLEGTHTGGVDFDLMLKDMGFVKEDVTFCNQYTYMLGFNDEYMANAYNAMDVLLAASMSEGFGIPLIEAQACGTPVITTDYSSMPELTFAGCSVPISQRFWNPLGAWMAMPDIDALTEALEWAYSNRGGTQIREKARDGALPYDWDTVVADGWKPLLEEIAAEIQSKAPAAHVHQWYSIGLHNKEGALCVPCKDKLCESEMQFRKDGTQVIVPNAFKREVNGVTLDIEDDPNGGVLKVVLREIAQDYDFDSIPFQAGDVVLDIGAHVGIVSMYLAKKYPFLTIHAFEPMPDNYARLLGNLKANKIENVGAYNFAVTGNGRHVNMIGDPKNNSGAWHIDPQGTVSIPSMTLAEIFSQYGLYRVKLLKIDTEGAEWEILSASPQLLERVDYLRGELHGEKGAETAALVGGYLGERAKWTNPPKEKVSA